MKACRPCLTCVVRADEDALHKGTKNEKLNLRTISGLVSQLSLLGPQLSRFHSQSLIELAGSEQHVFQSISHALAVDRLLAHRSLRSKCIHHGVHDFLGQGWRI